MTTSKSESMSFGRNWTHIIIAASIVVALFVIFPQLEQLQTALKTAFTSNVVWLLVASICLIGTYFTAAGAYYMVCRRSYSYKQFFKVELASGFVGRLLPANAAGLALNIRFISKRSGSKTQAASLVAINNLLGFVGYVLLIAVLALITSSSLSNAFDQYSNALPWILAIILAILVGIVITLILNRHWRTRLISSYNQLRSLLAGYKRQPQYILYTLGMNLITTILYVATLYCVVRAVGGHLSILETFTSFTLGLTGGAIIPTPGGLGGVEVGLYGGLFAAGLPSQLALSAVLVDRLLAYWLPMMPGLWMFKKLLKSGTI